MWAGRALQDRAVPQARLDIGLHKPSTAHASTACSCPRAIRLCRRPQLPVLRRTRRREFFSVDIGQRHPRGSRRLGSAPQALSMVLRNSGGQRRHAERSGRSAAFSEPLHHKSADWPGNNPLPLKSWTAEELAKLPTSISWTSTSPSPSPSPPKPRRPRRLPRTPAPGARAAGVQHWYERTGFQGGLQWYRCAISPEFNSELALYSGRTMTFRRTSSQARAIGGTTRGRARSRRCSQARALT